MQRETHCHLGGDEVKEDKTSHPPALTKSKGLVFMACVDGSTVSRKSMDVALSLLKPDVDKLIMAFVPPLLEVGYTTDNVDLVALETRANEKLRAMVSYESARTSHLKDFQVIIQRATAASAVKHEIVKLVKANKADFVLVGNRGLGLEDPSTQTALGKDGLGTTALFVALNSPCNVIIVKR